MDGMAELLQLGDQGSHHGTVDLTLTETFVLGSIARTARSVPCIYAYSNRSHPLSFKMVSKYKRKCLYGDYKGNSKVEENVVEELADVYMCMEQIIRYMGEDKVMTMLETKLGKLQEEIVYMEKLKEEKK